MAKASVHPPHAQASGAKHQVEVADGPRARRCTRTFHGIASHAPSASSDGPYPDHTDDTTIRGVAKGGWDTHSGVGQAGASSQSSSASAPRWALE